MNFYIFLDVLITIGGRGPDSQSVLSNYFNTETDLNCSIANLPEYNNGHAAIKAKMGILSCGGTSKKCWRLTDNFAWTSFPSMNEKRSYFTLNQIKNRLVAVGGVGVEDSLEYIDFNTGKEWTTKTLNDELISFHCSITLDDRFIWMIGGYINGEVNKII